jgi:amidase
LRDGLILLKDSFCLENIPSTIGYVSFLDHPPSSKNSALVEVLLSLGAVLYVKTNIPQTMMVCFLLFLPSYRPDDFQTADSDNNIFGRTLNPHNIALTAGGSSGGEGALVAFRGSVLGVGTDIAGSIRIPSLCCGAYGFKPTTDRVPFGEQTSPTADGVPSLVPCAGPLANSLADLEVFMKSILDANPWEFDSSAVAIPWRDLPHWDRSKHGLVIGVLSEDPSFPLHPPVLRAMSKAAEFLRAAGHTLIPLSTNPDTSISLGCHLAFKYFNLDPENTSLKHILASGESMVNSVLQASPAGDSEHLPAAHSIAELMEMNIQRSRFWEEWRKLWVSNKLDAIIAPGAQNTAVAHDTYRLPPYTVIWNVLDVGILLVCLNAIQSLTLSKYPACIIPYSRASKELDPEPVDFTVPAIGPKCENSFLESFSLSLPSCSICFVYMLFPFRCPTLILSHSE